MKSSALHYLRRVPVSPLLCFALAWLVTQTEVVKRIEWRTLDWRTGVRAAFQRPPDPRIAIVLFGDDTNDNLAPWPTDRSVHGDMIKLLTLGGPKVITWDVILDAQREGDGDAKMAYAAVLARRAGSTVITASTSTAESVDDKATPDDAGPTRILKDVRGDISRLEGDRNAIRPFPALRKESLYAFANAPHGADGVQREIPLVVRIGRDVYASLALQTIMSYYDVPANLVRVRLGDAIYVPTKQRGELRIPISDRGFYLINYRYDRSDAGGDFHEWEYIQAMLELNARYVDGKPVFREMRALRGGIVFIGQIVTGKADAGPTPLGAYSPLVLIHANAVNNILTNDYARVAPTWAVGLAAAVIGYAGLILGLRRSVWTLAAFAGLVLGLYVIGAFWTWTAFSLWLPFTWPLTGFVALQFIVIGRRVLQEQHAREQVKQMFGSYLSPELLEKMIKGGVNVAAISSERRPVTVLFSDLRDFTALTESMPDDLLVAQLNEYLAAMVECIHHEGGSLHKFIGDAVMAVWGDLDSAGVKNDASRAARAALAMQARLAQLNEKWRTEGKPLLRMGIGLNHGVVLIGNIGSPRKKEFAAIGDAVNLASRLESENKTLKTSMLVGESVRALIEDEFVLQPRGELPIKGKQKPVAVFELVGPKTAV